jgi:hypothetical protein
MLGLRLLLLCVPISAVVLLGVFHFGWLQYKWSSIVYSTYVH